MIENIKKIIIAIPLICLAILPPIKFDIPVIVNSDFWFWSILLVGFLGVLFIYTKADVFLKILVIYLFINCFRSRAPYLSFTSYIILIAVVYYYLLGFNLKDFNFIKKIVQAIFFLNIIMIINQQFNGDKLLNFGRDAPVFFGTIGNSMWLGSFLICLAPFLLLSSRWNIIPLLAICFISKSSGMVLSLIAWILVYGFLRYRKKIIFWLIAGLVCLSGICFAINDGVLWKFKVDRFPIWKRTISLSNKYPFFGWGMATYKIIIPVFTQDIAGGRPGPWEYEGTKGDWLTWRQAHNCWLQADFEIGKIGDVFLLLFLGSILIGLLKLPKTHEITTAISSMAMIATDMSVHYPSRQIQSVLLMIIFLSYCKKLTTKEAII